VGPKLALAQADSVVLKKKMYETCDQRNYPFQAFPEAIPRSYYYPTSEGSEAGSPGGGDGGGSFGNRGSLRSSNQQTQSQGLNYERSQEDTPFDPSTYAISPVQSPARRDFALPPEHSLPASLVRAVGIILRILRTLNTSKAQRHSQFRWRRSTVQWQHWTVPAFSRQPPAESEPVTWRRLWPPSSGIRTVGTPATGWVKTRASATPEDRNVSFFLVARVS